MRSTRLPDHRDVWRIAAPMILSSISVPLLGMVDTGVVGHLDSPTYLGAVAIGGTIFTFIYMGMNFLRMGTTGIAAQAFGADDAAGTRSALAQALIVALAIAFSLLVLQQPIRALALTVIGGDAATQALAQQYFSIRIWSAPGTLANLVFVGWFIGLQDGRSPLAIFLSINLTNIALDLIFVVGLGMTVDGVALASVIAEYCGLAVAMVLARRRLASNEAPWTAASLLRLRSYVSFFTINANLFVRTMALMFTMAFVTAWGARLGPLTLAANTVLMNFFMLTALGLDGIAHAAEALVGKAIGAGRRDALAAAVRVTMLWSVVFAVGFTLLFLLAGKPLVGLLTDLVEVRARAAIFLPWVVAIPLVSVWCFLYDGVFVGATRAREMRDVMLLSLLVVFLPAIYLSQPLGNHGLWLALLLFLASRGIGMHVLYRRRILNRVG